MTLLADVCADDPQRLRAALAGVRAYQDNPWRGASPPKPVVSASGGTQLRDYGGSGSTVVFVPSLINPPTVLDLDAGNSLLEWLATQGLRPLLVDWGTWHKSELAFGFEEVIMRRLVPLLRSIEGPISLAGYCLGGALALAAAAHIPVERVALLAAPWHFDGYEFEQRADVAAHHTATASIAEALACFPMDLLQPMFWALDREVVATKFANFAGREPGSPAARAFVALEDWANEGPPLPLGVSRELFEALFAGNLPGCGEWIIGGKTIRPERLGVPILDVVATRDRIVPAASALGLGTRLEIAAGHVGMIVGGRAPALLWEPLARWLRGD